MAKSSARKAAAGRYSEELLKRFDQAYGSMPLQALDTLLRQEFKTEMHGRSKDPKIWECLAYRRGLRKTGKTPMPEQVAINPSTPDVSIPTAITFGSRSYPISLLRGIAQGLMVGETLGTAYEHTATVLHMVIDKDVIPTLGNFFRLRFKANIKEFPSLSEEVIANTLDMEARAEVVRHLHQEKWRDAAIIEKTAALFPNLAPLTPQGVKSIGNFWRREKSSKVKSRRKEQVEQAPIRSLVKKVEDKYELSIAGPELQYRETVNLVRAKTILRLALTEERQWLTHVTASKEGSEL